FTPRKNAAPATAPCGAGPVHRRTHARAPSAPTPVSAGAGSSTRGAPTERAIERTDQLLQRAVGVAARQLLGRRRRDDAMRRGGDPGPFRGRTHAHVLGGGDDPLRGLQTRELS